MKAGETTPNILGNIYILSYLYKDYELTARVCFFYFVCC